MRRWKFISYLGANYIISWRKQEVFISYLGANYIISWRKLYHILAQTIFVINSKSYSCVIHSLLINNLNNNIKIIIVNYLRKKEARPKKVLEFLDDLFLLYHILAQTISYLGATPSPYMFNYKK